MYSLHALVTTAVGLYSLMGPGHPVEPVSVVCDAMLLVRVNLAWTRQAFMIGSTWGL